MDETRYTLSEPERAQVVEQLQRALAQRPEVVFAYLHGSFLFGIPFHDIDIALSIEDAYLQQVHPLDYILELSVCLSDAVHLPVDVHLLNEAPLGFQFYATAGQLLLSRDKARRYEFIEHVRRDYWDSEPMIRHHLREVLK